MGLALLVLRLGVMESGMFAERCGTQAVSRGNFFALFSQPRAGARRYLSVILVGVPIWYVVGILITFAPELGRAMGMSPAPTGPERGAGGATPAWRWATSAAAFSARCCARARRCWPASSWLTALFVVAYFTVGRALAAAFYARVRGPGRRHRLLGGVRHRGQRAVRHQHPRHGDHHRAQLRARRRWCR